VCLEFAAASGSRLRPRAASPVGFLGQHDPPLYTTSNVFIRLGSHHSNRDFWGQACFRQGACSREMACRWRRSMSVLCTAQSRAPLCDWRAPQGSVRQLLPRVRVGACLARHPTGGLGRNPHAGAITLSATAAQSSQRRRRSDGVSMCLRGSGRPPNRLVRGSSFDKDSKPVRVEQRPNGSGADA
jgi:hypothetical protein